MKECTTAAVYRSLQFCKGRTVLPGIRTRVYYIPKRDIVRWPTLPSSTPAGMDRLAIYQGSFVLAADKTWHVIDLIDNKGKIESESQGIYPARTFLNKIGLTHPGTGSEATGFASQANADDFVFLVRQRDGKFRVIGNPFFPTVTKPKQDSGEDVTATDFGTTLDVEVTDICPAPFYEGLIHADIGDIDAVDGKPYVRSFDPSFDPTFR